MGAWISTTIIKMTVTLEKLLGLIAEDSDLMNIGKYWK
jgi:hypothetical protein